MTSSQALVLYNPMNYQEAIEYIHQTPKFARELGNRMLEKLLMHLNNPQKNLRIVHIAGTNGKGSTAAMLAEILQSSGYKCGLFTSPYIERFNERIKINGKEIPDEALAGIITIIKQTIERYDAPVSEFALDTAAAFCWFKEQKCDYVVLETGLGGRLDATNVIQNPILTVLTSIGMDHMQYLGNTIEKITEEKCGIIKTGCPVVSYPLQEEVVKKVIREKAREKKAPLTVAKEPIFLDDHIRYENKEYKLGLSGEYQAYNAATVLESVHVLRECGAAIDEVAVSAGLKNAKNPARFESFGSNIILDGGHNVPAGKALISSLKNKKKPLFFCVAMMEDKEWKGFLNEIVPAAEGVVFTEVPMPRCCSANQLATFAELFQKKIDIEKNPFLAIEKIRKMAGEEGIVCICGSLYLAGEVRPWLREKEKDGQI